MQTWTCYVYVLIGLSMMEAGWMEDYLDLLTWSYQTMFIWEHFTTV